MQNGKNLRKRSVKEYQPYEFINGVLINYEQIVVKYCVTLLLDGSKVENKTL